MPPSWFDRNRPTPPKTTSWFEANRPEPREPEPAIKKWDASKGRSHGKVIDYLYNQGGEALKTMGNNAWNFLNSSQASEFNRSVAEEKESRLNPQYGTQKLAETKQAYADVSPARMALGVVDPGQNIAGTIDMAGSIGSDIMSGNLGRAAGNVGTVAIPAALGYGISKYLPRKAAVNVVPPPSSPTQYPFRNPRMLTEVAGQPANVKRNPVIPPERQLNAPPPVVKPPTEPGFISHPSGAVGRVGDPNLTEGLRALDLEKPTTTVGDYDRRPGDYTTLEGTPPPAWDFDKAGTRKGPETGEAPFTQGVQERPTVTGTQVIKTKLGELKLRVVTILDRGGKKVKKTTHLPISEEAASAIRNKKIDGLTIANNWLDQNPLYSHVPDRLRPEPPNVGAIRGTAIGGQKVGDTAPGSRLQFEDQPKDNANWTGEHKTVELGEGLPPDTPPLNKLNYAPDMPPNKVEPLTPDVIARHQAAAKLSGMVSGPSAPPKAPLRSRMSPREPGTSRWGTPTEKPPLPPAPVEPRTPNFQSGKGTLGENFDVIPGQAHEPVAKRVTVSKNARPDDVRFRQSQGYVIKGLDKEGNIVMEYKPVDTPTGAPPQMRQRGRGRKSRLTGEELYDEETGGIAGIASAFPEGKGLHTVDDLRKIAGGQGDIDLYHGTTHENAEAIGREGIKLPESGEAAAQEVAKRYGIPWAEWKHLVEPEGVGSNYGKSPSRLSTATGPIAERWSKGFPQGEIYSDLNAKARMWRAAKAQGRTKDFDAFYNEVAARQEAAGGTTSLYDMPNHAGIGADDLMAPSGKPGRILKATVDSRAIPPSVKAKANSILRRLEKGEITEQQALSEWNDNYQDIKVAPQNVKDISDLDVDTSVLEDEGLPPVAPISEAVGSADAPQRIAKVEGKIEGIMGNLRYGKFMQKNPVFKGIMDKLIKWRSADKMISRGIRNEFPDVAAVKKDKIVDFQEALGKGQFPKVREFFDKQRKRLTDLGIDLGYKENYLPQMWEDSADDVAKVFGSNDKELNRKASFQFRSFIEDYKKGIEKGLTPKMSPIELMEYYGKRVNKLIADNEAINHLQAQGYLVERKHKTDSMVAMDPNLVTFGKYYAEPDIKRVIEGYLKSAESQSPAGSGISKAVGKWSNLMLSSGIIPKPIFTMHGANISLPFQGRAFREGGWKRNLKALQYGWNPKKAAARLDKANAKMEWAAKEHGFSAGIGDVATQGPEFFPDTSGNWAKRLGKKTVNKLTGIQNRYFEKPLLEEMLPALKWDSWEDNYAKYLKEGMSEREAGKLATQVSDDYYGGKNLDLLYNNKNFNTFARVALLAPDWFRTTFRLGKQTTKAATLHARMSGSERMAYLAGASRWLATYAAANMLHKAMNGKFMVENDDPFAFEMGKDANGKTRSFKVFAGAADDFKLAIQELNSAKSGGSFEKRMNFLENRFSPLGQLGQAVITGGNYKNETNWGRTHDQYGKEVPSGERIANSLSQIVNMGPPQVSAPFNYLTGKYGEPLNYSKTKTSAEEALMRIAEIPISYKDPKKKQSPFPKFKNPLPPSNASPFKDKFPY